MDKSFDIKRREEFKALLQELAKADSFLEDSSERSNFYRKFEHIYYISNQERFRHFYSDIFSLLVEINTDTSLVKGDIDVLGENLSFLVRGYKAMNLDNSGNLIDISESLWKLYDHVSLDIARIRYSNREDDRLSQELKFAVVSKKLDESQNKIDELTNETTTLKESLSRAQLDYIAILGIFASVVLAFVGGLAFSTSVLQNIASASIYRLILVSAIIGAVFIAVIHLMFYYVGKLSGRLSGQDAPHGYFWIAYAILAIIIAVVILGWHHGWVESRNDRIESKYTDTDEITPEVDTADTSVQTECEIKNTPEE